MDFRPLTNRAFKESAADIVGKLSGTEPTITTAAGDNLPLDNAVAAEYMGKIKDAITKELPTYTSTDANKVLAVNAQGTGIGWNPAGGGGAEKFVVTFTEDDHTGEITSDKTPQQIYTAYTSGKIVEGHRNSHVYMLSLADYDESYGDVGEYQLHFTSGQSSINIDYYSQSGSVYYTIEERYIPAVPNQENTGEIIYGNNNWRKLSIGSSGQVLTVENGKPAWKTLLPTYPSSDGTYVLKCTVTSGTPVLSWVADT